MDEIKVIIADDNIEILEKLRGILENIDKIKLVGIAKDGEEEYEMIKELKPDLVITDLEMPKMTGIEVFEKAKEERIKKIPQVIFITGRPSTDFIKRAIKIGTLDIIYKPFKEDKIEEVIERNRNMLLEEEILIENRNEMIKQESFLSKIIKKITLSFESILHRRENRNC